MSRRLLTHVLALLGLLVVALPLTAAPAYAVEPIGGCWIWFGGPPARDISTSLAPWADEEAEPKGPADHTIALTPSAPPAGSTGTINYAFNKGPKNAGPAAQVQGEFRFSVNDDQEVTTTVDFGLVSTGESIPGKKLKIPFEVEEGDNVVVFEGAIFTAQAFNVKIDCNGQASGTSKKNPRNTPEPTNVTATVTSSGTADQGVPTPQDPSALTSVLCGLGLPLGDVCSTSGGEDPDPSGPEDPDTGTDPGTDTDGSGTDPDATGSGTDPDAQGSGTTGASTGTPAAGKVDFDCVLQPFNSDFDYQPQISVSGGKGGDAVQLVASMADLPGIAPVPIDGPMEVTLGLVADGKATTLKGRSDVQAAPKSAVPVPDLTGSVATSAASFPVSVSSFGFYFPSYEITATCKPASGEDLGELTVGDKVASGGGSSSSGSGVSSAGGSSDTGGTAGVPGSSAPVTEAAGPAAAAVADVALVDVRVEGARSLGELFGAAPRRTLVVVMQNPTDVAITGPAMMMAVGRSGATPAAIDLGALTLQPQETRRIEMTVQLSSAGFGTYHVIGQVGATPAGAFDTSYSSYPWGLIVLALVGLALAVWGLLRSGLLRRGVAPATIEADDAAPRSDGGTGGDAVVDLSQLDRWWQRRPVPSSPRPAWRLTRPLTRPV